MMNTSTNTSESPTRAAIGRLVFQMEHADDVIQTAIDVGDLAAIKRMDITIPAPAFWRLLANISDGDMPMNVEKWALVAKAISLLQHNAGGQESFGSALAKCGFSESSDLRIARLLKAEGSALADYGLSAVRYLANKAVPVNKQSVADFLYWQNKQAKLRLANDFYATRKD